MRTRAPSSQGHEGGTPNGDGNQREVRMVIYQVDDWGERFHLQPTSGDCERREGRWGGVTRPRFGQREYRMGPEMLLYAPKDNEQRGKPRVIGESSRYRQAITPFMVPQPGIGLGYIGRPIQFGMLVAAEKEL
jgi:hypothetical protein